MARDVLDISRYVGVSHSQRAIDRLTGFETRFSNVLQTGRLPENGFSEAEIEAILHKLALMDSNNWSNSTGVGEREGRILLDIVRRRHFGLAHGIGRSGDITAIQPKAPGSSLINQLVNSLLLDWLRRSGAPSTASCLLVPMATGMTLTFCLLTLKRRRGPQAKYVVWPRIDQKSCLKCIATAGLIPVPIEPIQSSGRRPKHKGSGSSVAGDSSGDLPADQLASNLPAIEAAIKDPEGSLLATPATDCRPGPESVVCVLSTTSCFSPRVPDRILAISSLCEAHNVPHLINNAYGVQSKRCMGMIEASWGEVKRRRQSTQRPLDLLYVQSTDKNLMVPVGGSIIAGFSTELLRDIAESYPGRASGTPSLDVFATLLYLGRGGWDSLVSKREVCYLRLAEGLRGIAAKHRLRLMHTPDNPISLALSLQGLGDDHDPDALTLLGAKLFTQGCSGVR
uniref:O-phosphoseryl-tRNA(Sec) selenium transferase n=1 Tax=Mesocestoides corti TaxID=53468 RepID=A0A5K3FTF6_MESCO